ncbi:MAG: ABC transporter permease [Clostridia bacterium]|nr:ABC transporter permease [Clostridia bacterium]MDY5559015.1 ABC transporter permease [Candidatus Heritagella sp.]
MIDSMGEAIRVLFRKPLRSFLTMLGILIGVASVILIGVISQYGTDMLGNEMESLGLSSLMITSEDTRFDPLGEEELFRINSMEGVADTSPVLMQTGEVAAGDVECESMLWGVSYRADHIISLQIVAGRVFNASDCMQYRDVCLIDESLSKQAFDTIDSVGKQLQIEIGNESYTFTVAGVVKTGTGLLQNLLSGYIPSFIYLPYTTMQLYSGRSNFDQIAVKTEDGVSADWIGEEVVEELNRVVGVDGYSAGNLAGQKESLKNILNLCTLVFSAVGGISLLVASLSIMTIMFISIQERKQEIGIKKALGAGKGRIMLDFLSEALLLSGVGSAAGIAVGLLVCGILAVSFGITVHIRTEIVISAVFLSIISAVLFSLWPAKRAADMRPVDALRQE